MKILVLTSGGDAPGMNMLLYRLYKKFGNNIYACKSGFKGLIENDIYLLKSFKPYENRNFAGSILKSARCIDFKKKEGFLKGLKTAKAYDCVIILGGNGSYKGACDLAQNGVKTIFIPSTIDNDVDISEYSQGFDTAVQACCDYIDMTIPTMETFNRSCVFEVMGRECDEIALATAKRVRYDYLVQNEKDIDYKKIAKIVKERFMQEHSSSIIIRENILPVEKFVENLSKECEGIEVKYSVVGYIQRGKAPTKTEIKFAKEFARLACKTILSSSANCTAIVYNNGKFQTIDNFF